MGAVRWIRRAAEAAETAGNDPRALELARCAADLTSSLETASLARDEAAALAAFDDFNDQTIVEAPASLGERQVSKSAPSQNGTAAAVTPAWTGGAVAVVRTRQTLRVAVGLTSEADGGLSVRVLPDGISPPVGATEALLVLLDPEARVAVPPDRG